MKPALRRPFDPSDTLCAHPSPLCEDVKQDDFCVTNAIEYHIFCSFSEEGTVNEIAVHLTYLQNERARWHKKKRDCAVNKPSFCPEGARSDRVEYRVPRDIRLKRCVPTRFRSLRRQILCGCRYTNALCTDAPASGAARAHTRRITCTSTRTIRGTSQESLQHPLHGLTFVLLAHLFLPTTFLSTLLDLVHQSQRPECGDHLCAHLYVRVGVRGCASR